MSPVRRRSTIVEDIADELRTMIVTGQLQPGQFLEPQKALADRFGVGLSTVRESTQLLAAVGLVESHPGKGTWVRQDAFSKIFNSADVKTRLSDLNARQVYEARLVIEVGLTRFAALRATGADIQRIWQAVHEMEAARADDKAFVQADLEFHLAVARAGHNDLLEQFYHLVRELLSEVITQMVMLPDVKEESIGLQKAIAQAIEAHDEGRAQEAAQMHMHYIEDLLRTYG
jgi:GntR family transcriptional repressor for pyruvate dehydrogenase complex